MISENKLKCIRKFEEGLHLYRNKEFRDAIGKFEDALLYDSNDGPSRLFITRCNYFLEHPVPDDWDGIFEMKTK